MEAWQGDYARRSYGYSVFTQYIPPSQSGLALTICRKEDARWKICGIPEVLYTDNGSDFTSRDLEQVSADLKTDLYSQHQGYRAAEAASSASFIDRSDVSAGVRRHNINNL
jgi:transposase InsO family protein